MSPLGIRPYTRGLHELGRGSYAWLQPDGSWGWSNAGLIADGPQALLVDTLFDWRLTGEMLDAMRAAEPRARSIGAVVNTHSNGDHCNGNALLPDARIYASAAAAEEMAHESPAMMAALMRRAPGMGEVGEFFQHCFAAFEFEGVEQRLPTDTFVGALDIMVGEKQVRLRQVGPAHTRGDVIVHVPGERLAFTGDILFVEGHPIIWAGPVQNWIEACGYLLSLELEVVVPGHGPITDARGVAAVRDYLIFVRDEARRRFDAGMPASEAMLDVALGDYDAWGDAERIAVNVATLYKEFAGDTTPNDVAQLFGSMAHIHRARQGRR